MASPSALTTLSPALDTFAVARVLELNPPVVTPPAAAVGVFINAGGGAFTDSAGRAWVPDIDFTGTNGGVFATPTAVAGDSVDAPLYQTERWGMDGYDIPVGTAGVYTVKLHLAEINPDSGQRVFSVTCEGQPFLTDYDITAKAGGAFKAVIETFVVQVTDLSVSLAFSASVGSAKVSAIEVIPGGTLPVTVPPIITPPATLPGGDTPTGNPASGTGTPMSATPPPMQLSGPVLLNPAMGAVVREEQNYAPTGGTPLHAFKRDGLRWRDIEKVKGQYTWDVVEVEVAKARARGGTFGCRFPLMGMGDQRVPDYIKNDPGTYGGFWDAGGNQFVPDLDNAAYQARWIAFWQAFKAKYGNDRAVDMMDVSGYGMWGEGHLYGAPSGTKTASLAALKIIYDAQVEAMPNKLWAQILGDSQGNMPGAVDYILSKASLTRPIGFRIDSGGHSSQYDNTASVAGTHKLIAYKTGPVVMEPANLHPNDTGYDPPTLASWQLALQQGQKYGMTNFMNGNTGSGEQFSQFSAADQAAWMQLCKTAGARTELRLVTIPNKIERGSYIKVHWEALNSGLSPHYYPTVWRWGLRDASGNLKWYRDVDSQLRGQLPGTTPIAHEAYFNMPTDAAALPSGTYDVVCYLLDAGFYGHPYKLAITTAQNADEGYTLGKVTVT